jgi:hypothetical protein
MPMPESALKSTRPCLRQSLNPRPQPATAKLALAVLPKPILLMTAWTTQSDWDRYASQLPLRWCCIISDAFRAADEQALWFQKRHRFLIYIADLAATSTVALAIVGLAYRTANGLKPGEGFRKSDQEVWKSGSKEERLSPLW